MKTINSLPLFYFKSLSIFLFFFLAGGLGVLQAQILKIDPQNPSPDDSISIFFYANKGNKALENYQGDVYMHTAVITGSVDEPSSWRYIQGNWGKDDYRVRMRRVGPNTYRKDIHIRSFYQLGISEPFLQLAFVFRNLNGSLVATPKDADEVYYPSLSELKALDLTEAHGQDGRFIGSFQAFELKENRLQLQMEGGDLAIHFFKDKIARLIFFPKGMYLLPQNDLIIAQNIQPEIPQVEENDSSITCNWGNQNQLIIQKYPLRLTWSENGKHILSEAHGFFQDTTDKTLGFRLRLQQNEKMYGGGAHALPLNRRSNRLYLYHKFEKNYSKGATPLNIGLPHLYSSKGYGILIDNGHKAYLDIGQKEANICEYGVRGSNHLSYYLMFNANPANLLKQLVLLTGKQPLPPLWALGYLESAESNITQSKLENRIAQYSSSRIPLEAVILADTWYGEKKQRGNFTWNPARFPNPTLMINGFREKGIKTVLGISPYVLTYSDNFGTLATNRFLATSSSGSPYIISDFEGGPASLIDIFQKEAAQWLWQQQTSLLAQGIDGWLSTMGEPAKHPYNMLHQSKKASDIHNLYNLVWARSLAQHYQKTIPDRRLFNLSRSGFLGLQRWQAFPFSGEPAFSWKALQTQPGIMLSMSMSGLPYMHSKIGQENGNSIDEELFLRWMQLGVFSPIMRSTPLNMATKNLSVLKEAIRLRYQFLPYNYSLAWQQAQYGLPLMRPMIYANPSDSNMLELEDQFLWGDQFLIAPVLEAGINERKVYFPKGQWVDFWYGESYGEGWQNVKVKQTEIPVFVKAGAIFPFAPSLKNTSQFKGDSLIFHYYPHLNHPNSTYELYLDNGDDVNVISNQNYRIIRFDASVSASKLEITYQPKGNSFLNAPASINCIWEIHGINTLPKKIKWMNRKLQNAESLEIFTKTPNSYYLEVNTARLFLHINWHEEESKLYMKIPKWDIR